MRRSSTQLRADSSRGVHAVRKGGRVVCAGIHMSDIPRFPYHLLWEERQLMSVANLTRQDGIDFLRIAAAAGVVTETTRYPLDQANQALADLRAGRFEGAAVSYPESQQRSVEFSSTARALRRKSPGPGIAER